MSTILYNANIRTQGTPARAEIMVTDADKILWVGSDMDEAQKAAGEGAELRDLGGRTVIPSLIDAHTHPTCIALTDWRVQLPRTNDLTELLESAAAYCREHPVSEVPYFFGESFLLTMFDEKGPNRELLDRYISDRPARLQDFTDHSCWYNSRALELMGISKENPEPEILRGTVGDIILDENGEPTGWVREVPDEKLELPMYDAIDWHPDRYPTEKSLTPFLDYLKTCGVTALMDGFTQDEESIRLFSELDRAGKLDMYYEGMALLPSYDALDETIALAREWQKKYTGKHVHLHTVKFFMDGTNELGDCGSLRPFETDPTGTDYGSMNMNVDELTDTMLRLNEAGLDLHLHIVGDRTFRTVCDAMERAEAAAGENWRIDVTSAHCEITHPDDRPRPAKLGMIVNWSPHWSGGYFGTKARDYLGVDRFDSMYDFTQIIASGACVTFSSDVFSYKEADRADPFFGMQVAATRIDPQYPLDPEEYPGSVRTPASARLNAGDLIAGYTARAARQLRLNDRIGRLEPGMDADYLILPTDPVTAAPASLGTIRPDEVWFEGKRIR